MKKSKNFGTTTTMNSPPALAPPPPNSTKSTTQFLTFLPFLSLYLSHPSAIEIWLLRRKSTVKKCALENFKIASLLEAPFFKKVNRFFRQK